MDDGKDLAAQHTAAANLADASETEQIRMDSSSPSYVIKLRNSSEFSESDTDSFLHSSSAPMAVLEDGAELVGASSSDPSFGPNTVLKLRMSVDLLGSTSTDTDTLEDDGKSGKRNSISRSSLIPRRASPPVIQDPNVPRIPSTPPPQARARTSSTGSRNQSPNSRIPVHVRMPSPLSQRLAKANSSSCDPPQLATPTDSMPNSVQSNSRPLLAAPGALVSSIDLRQNSSTSETRLEDSDSSTKVKHASALDLVIQNQSTNRSFDLEHDLAEANLSLLASSVSQRSDADSDFNRESSSSLSHSQTYKLPTILAPTQLHITAPHTSTSSNVSVQSALSAKSEVAPLPIVRQLMVDPDKPKLERKRSSLADLLSSRRASARESDSIPPPATWQTLFVARALYDSAAEEPEELALVAGVLINVFDNSHEDWWFGEVCGSVGYFPANYVEIMASHPSAATPLDSGSSSSANAPDRTSLLSTDSASDTSSRPTEQIESDDDDCMLVEALYDFQATTAAELSFSQGERIEVCSNSAHEQWWGGSIGDRYGWFPAAFVKVVDSLEQTPTIVASPRLRRAYSAGQASASPILARKSASGAQAKVSEIVATELEFVGDLETMLDVYMAPMRSLLSTVFDLQSIYNVTSCVDAILEHQRTFKAQLSAAASNSSVAGIGQCFNTWCESYHIYLPYFSVCSKVLKELDLLLHDNQQAAAFLENCRTSGKEQVRPLQDYIGRPIQRVLKYSRLLKDLLATLDPATVDYEVVADAYDRMTNACIQLNSKKLQMEDVMRIEGMLVGWDGPVLTDITSQLLLEGDLMKISGQNCQQRHCFLFENVFVYCKKTIGGEYDVRGRIMTDSMSITPLEDNEAKFGKTPLVNAFKITHDAKGKWYILYCKTSKDKQSWVDAFERERGLRELASSGGGEKSFRKLARVSIPDLLAGGKDTRKMMMMKHLKSMKLPSFKKRGKVALDDL